MSTPDDLILPPASGTEMMSCRDAVEQSLLEAPEPKAKSELIEMKTLTGAPMMVRITYEAKVVGGGGAVYLNCQDAQRNDVVVKTIDLENLASNEYQTVFAHARDAQNEISVNKYLHSLPISSKYIAKMVCYGYSNTKKRIKMYLVFEKGSGDTYDHMLASGNKCRREDRLAKAQRLFKDLMRGVDFLHKNRVAHLDIKPENLVCFEDNAKIIDFGMSKVFEEQEMKDGNPVMNKNRGTTRYKAPEVHNCGQYNAFCADVWSCGVVLYTYLVKSYPYTFPSESDDGYCMIIGDLERYIKEQLKLPREIDCPPQEAIDLLKSIFVPENERPTAQQILQSPFLTMSVESMQVQRRN